MGAAEILILLLLLAWIPGLVISGMKERWVWFVLGIVFVIPAYFGFFVSARPGSSWDRRSGGTALHVDEKR